MKKSKTILTSAANVIFDAHTKALIEKIKKDVSIIVSQTECNPTKLMNYVINEGTKVYKINYADKFFAD